MKLKARYLLITSLCLLSGQVFGQEKEVEIKFKKETLNFNEVYDTLPGLYTDESFTIEIQKKSDTVKLDVIIELTLDHMTTNNEDLLILNPLLKIKKDEFKNKETVTREIFIRIYKDTLENSDEVCKIVMVTDTAKASLKKDNIFVTILNGSELKSEEEEAQKSIIKTFEIIDTINIGAFIFPQNYKHITVYTKKNNRKNKGADIFDTIEISNVMIQIYCGRIEQILISIEGTDGYFKNRVPISVTNFDRRRADCLYYKGPDTRFNNTFVRLGEIVDYIILTKKQYFPNNERLIVNSKHPIDTTSFTKSPSAFFDARTYTDPIGLNGNPNGLVQTEVNARFIGNTNNIRNTHATFFSFVNLNASYSKFDSDFDTLKIASFDDRSENELLRMVQFSSIGISVEIELIKYSRVHDAYLNLGHKLLMTPMSDSTGSFKRVWTPSFYLQLGGVLFSTPVIRGVFNFPIYCTYLHDQPFINYAKNWNFILQPEIEIIIDPIKKTSSDGSDGASIFGRIKYYDMPNAKGNNFVQIQIGANIPVSSLFKKK